MAVLSVARAMPGGRLNRAAGAPRGWQRGGADYIEMGTHVRTMDAADINNLPPN